VSEGACGERAKTPLLAAAGSFAADDDGSRPAGNGGVAVQEYEGATRGGVRARSEPGAPAESAAPPETKGRRRR
jgi:hypothetical protein